MKKTIHLLAFLLFVSTKSNANNEKDCTSEVRAMISAQAPRNGHNPILAAQAFDFIIELYKIKAIYLDSTRTGMSHYNVLKRTLLINVGDSTVSVLQKVFGELTHAVQFTWRPLHYTKSAFSIFGKTFLKALFCRKRERYRARIDSIKANCGRPQSNLRTAFIAIYLEDAYCEYDSGYQNMHHQLERRHKGCDEKSFEHEHPEIEGEVWRLYDDLIFLLQHLSPGEVRGWLKMRKRLIHKNLRFRQRFLFFVSSTLYT